MLNKCDCARLWEAGLPLIIRPSQLAAIKSFLKEGRLYLLADVKHFLVHAQASGNVVPIEYQASVMLYQ